MPVLMEAPPHSQNHPITEVLHGIAVTDHYRWLEDQESVNTREWLAEQTRYARAYFDSIPGRERIRQRVRELLDVETYDSILKLGPRYFFRKRLPGQEQPCICFRDGFDGKDEVLINPIQRGTGPYTAVKPLRISPDGRLLLYEVKQGGERTGTFELFDIENRKTLPDALPRGYLRGFAFSSDSQSFYYTLETLDSMRSRYRAAHKHVLGTNFSKDIEIFFAGEDEKIQLYIVAGTDQLGFLVYRFLDRTYTDFYLWPFGSETAPEPLIRNAEFRFSPFLLKGGRVLAITDRDAPNSRIVEVCPRAGLEPQFADVIPTTDVPIRNATVTESRILVTYTPEINTQVLIFDLFGKHLGELPINELNTVCIVGSSANEDEVFFEQEGFTKPTQIYGYSPGSCQAKLWAERKVPLNSSVLSHRQVWFTAQDGTRIPMFLVGERDILENGSHPTIMTSYGGFGVPMTPQFSVFVTFLMERGCLFALPNIRGGSEFGVGWHNSAKRRNRQVAFDDFLCAAEWLIETGRTEPHKLAIFGGSNSGLLVGAAMTQRPELFRAVVCMVPMLDMLRYHRFDDAHVWKDEFGTAEDPDDFTSLLSYSPYHQVREGVAYPATMIVSGDADQNCNPLHARKMTARLQACSVSRSPILLDYSRHRGHSPVLALSERVEALTDRMAFLCDQLQLLV